MGFAISPAPFSIFNTMDIYTYVAQCSPSQSFAILQKYGYSIKDVHTSQDLGICLKKLVSFEGENALKDILECHPDRDVLMEVSKTKKKDEYKNMDGSSEGCCCRCKSCGQYRNASGEEDKASKNVQITGLLIMASALILASAIIAKN